MNRNNKIKQATPRLTAQIIREREVIPVMFDLKDDIKNFIAEELETNPYAGSVGNIVRGLIREEIKRRAAQASAAA